MDNKKHYTILILILGSITAIAPMTIDMYLPAFNAITKSLNASESQLQLTLSSYFIGMALSQIIYGPIVDRFGKKIPLFIGLVIYIITSILCCLAKNIETLIILRFFQALGVCACLVVPRAIVRDVFTPQDSAKVFSHLMLVIGLAPIFAPFLGSILLLQFGWESIFIFSAFFGFLCLLLSYFLPPNKGANKEDKISHALKKYLYIIKDRDFIVPAICGGLSVAGLLSYVTGSPTLYMNFFKMSAHDYSLIFSCNAICFIFMSQLNAYLLKKFSIKQVLRKTILMPSICGVALIYFSYFNPQLWIFIFLFSFFLGGVGAINPNTTALAMAKHAKHSGSASALLGTVQFSIAAIFSILISKFQGDGISPFVVITSCTGFFSMLVFWGFYRKN